MTDRTINLKEAANIVRHECGEWTGLAETIIRRFKELPTVDALEVIRCRDCKRWDKYHNEQIGECKWTFRVTKAEGYCDDAERKDGDDGKAD